MIKVSVLSVVGIRASLTVNKVLTLVVTQVCAVVNLNESIHRSLIAHLTTWDYIAACLAAFFGQKVPLRAAARPKAVHYHIRTLAIALADFVSARVVHYF